MTQLRPMDELSDEPVFIQFQEDDRPLQRSYELSAEAWLERYSFMREEYVKYLWFYSPICAKVQKMRNLLHHLCQCCLNAQNHPQKNENFPLIRDMDLILGLISPEEYERQALEERNAALKTALRDHHVNHALDEICGEIQKESDR